MYSENSLVEGSLYCFWTNLFWFYQTRKNVAVKQLNPNHSIWRSTVQRNLLWVFFRAIDRHLVNLQSQCLQFFAKIAQSLTRGQKLSIENRRGNIWQLFKDIGRFLLKPSGHTAAGKRNVSTEKRRAFDRRKTIVQKDLKNKQDNDSKKIFVYLYPDISLSLSVFTF